MALKANVTVLHDWSHENMDEARDEILNAVGDLSGFEIFGSQVLVGVYMRPVMKGRIITINDAPDDVHQSMEGLILKCGPEAFSENDAERYGGRVPAPGDWIFARVQDAVQLHVKFPGSKSLMVKRYDNMSRSDVVERARDFDGWHCRMLFAADIYGRIERPGVLV
jgi:hypothetical protein